MERRIHATSVRARRKAIRSRVWLNGVEVTNRCFYADDRRGIVRLYRHNEQGRPYVDVATQRAATEECRGRVVTGRQER